MKKEWISNFALTPKLLEKKKKEIWIYCGKDEVHFHRKE